MILTDIRGLEDHYGDCDFKIAGTLDGLTAIQLDIKLKSGIPVDVLCEALDRAEIARLSVLSKMNEVNPEPRQGVRKCAPSVGSLPVAQEDRKVVIGKGGAMIKLLEKLFDCKSSLDDQGNMIVFGSSASRKDNGSSSRCYLVRSVRAFVFESLCSSVCVRGLCSRAKQYNTIPL